MPLDGDALLRLSSEDPDAALAAGRAQAARAGVDGDARAQAHALRAVAAALLRVDPPASAAVAGDAVGVAERGGLPDVADQARVTLASALRITGRVREAERVLEAVVAAGHQPARAEALASLGALRVVQAEPGRARPLLDRALRELDPGSLWTAMALTNRGILTAMAGDLDRAAADLERARDLHLRGGSPRLAAEVSFNLVWVWHLAGEYARALRLLADVEPEMGRGGQSLVDVHIMRAMLLLAVGLAVPAADSARLALAELDRVATEADRPEALLRLTEALTMAGRHGDAAAVAEQAAAAFVAQHRPQYADRVALVGLAARARSGSATTADLAAARSLATRLSRGGQADVAHQARLTVAALALVLGRPARARQEVDRLAATVRAWPNPDLRTGYWRLRTALAAADGDERGVLAAARIGFEVLDGARGTLGATEARVNVAAAAEDLAGFALPVARRRGAAALFDSCERARGAALLMRPARPARSRTLAAAQARLRATATAVREAVDAGDDTRALLHRQAEQEHAVRAVLLTAGGDGGVPARTTARQVRAALGDRVLVSYVEVGGTLLAVRVDRFRCRLVDLGAASRVAAELSHVLGLLQRFARGRATGDARGRLTAAVAALDDVLLRPVDSSTRPLVVVPSAGLLGVPWGMLPSARTRPVTVAPSASAWVAGASRRRRASGRVVVAAGPDLPAAAAELTRVCAAWPATEVLDGPDATAAALLAAAEGADVFHLACHGVLRADNPLFSHLAVADGPLAVHDIEGLRRAPAVVVLSACDSALARPRPGGEWLGMASALLSVGTRSLVASVLPVPDGEATVTLMAALHARLAAGDAPAEALRRAGDAVDEADPVALATRAAFVCFGR